MLEEKPFVAGPSKGIYDKEPAEKPPWQDMESLIEKAAILRLIDLKPQFLSHPVVEDGKEAWHYVDADRLSNAAGIRFLCPKCFKENGGPVGTHLVVCWNPSVSLDYSPGPGRWHLMGTGFEDLTLKGVSGDSVLLTTKMGCQAHFFVRNGEIQMC